MKILKIFLLSLLIFSINKVYASEEILGTLTFPDTNDADFYLSSSKAYEKILAYDLSYDELYKMCTDIKNSDMTIYSYKYYACRLSVSSSRLLLSVGGFDDTDNASSFNNLSSTSSNTQNFGISSTSGSYVNYRINSDKTYTRVDELPYSIFGNNYYDYNDSFIITNGFINNYSVLEGYFYTNIDYWEDNKYINLEFIPERSYYFNYDNKLFNNENGNKFSLYDFGYKPFTNFVNEGLSKYLMPSYDYTLEYTDNGKILLNLKFNNYIDNGMYYFTLYNKITKEYYGIDSKGLPFYDDKNKYLPFEESFELLLDEDTNLELSLIKINNAISYKVINTEIINIYNTYDNLEKPYFYVVEKTNNFISGIFKNIGNLSDKTCYYKQSNDNVEHSMGCWYREDIEVNFNGYITFYVKDKNKKIIYQRDINFLGNSNLPFINYKIINNNEYKTIDWSIENFNSVNDIYFRYSIDNGKNFTEWSRVENENFTHKINVFNTNYVIIELSDNTHNNLYDKKSIYISNGLILDFPNSDYSDDINNIIGYLPPGPLDSILNLPITLLKSLLNGISGSCKPAKLTLPYVNVNLELPCQNSFYDKIGANAFFNTTGIIASALILYSYFISLYNWIDGILHLERQKVKIWGTMY